MSVDVAPSVKSGVSPEEYLAQEELAETRSEYVNGEIIPLTGASPAHCMIAGNLYFSLRMNINNDEFLAYPTDLKTRTNRVSFRYPDVTIVKSPLILDQSSKHVITNPLVIFEVLSPSTEANDRGEKFADYRSIDSLQAYVLVAQNKQSVECFTRQPDNNWLLSEPKDGELKIPPLDCSLELAQIYQNVDFETKQEKESK